MDSSAFSSSQEKIKNLDWNNIVKRLILFTKRRLGYDHNPEDAKEIVQAAICHFIEHKCEQWIPETQPILRYLGSIINGIISNKKKIGNRYLQIQIEDLANNSIDNKSDNKKIGNRKIPLERFADNSTEDYIINRNISEKKLIALTEKIYYNEKDFAVFDLFLKGIVSVNDQAKTLGINKNDIYKSRHRILNAWKEVNKEYKNE